MFRYGDEILMAMNDKDTKHNECSSFPVNEKCKSGKLAWASKSSDGGSEANNAENETNKTLKDSKSVPKSKSILKSNESSDNKKDIKSRFATSSSTETSLNHSKSSPNKPNPFKKEKERITQSSSRSLDRPSSWHGAYHEQEKHSLPKNTVRIHRNSRGLRCVPPVSNDQSKYSYNTSEFGCPYKPPKKPIVTWVSCNEGRVQPGAIVAGKEFNNPYTFIGRVTLRNERYQFGFHKFSQLIDLHGLK